MAFEDLYRLSAHAVITNEVGDILLLKATYGQLAWGLPGGALDPGETIHDCIARECLEELGQQVVVQHLTGVYYHRAQSSHAFIFRCSLSGSTPICLSSEHSEAKYVPLSELSPVQHRRVSDCLLFNGLVASARF